MQLCLSRGSFMLSWLAVRRSFVNRSLHYLHALSETLQQILTTDSRRSEDLWTPTRYLRRKSSTSLELERVGMSSVVSSTARFWEEKSVPTYADSPISRSRPLSRNQSTRESSASPARSGDEAVAKRLNVFFPSASKENHGRGFSRSPREPLFILNRGLCNNETDEFKVRSWMFNHLLACFCLLVHQPLTNIFIFYYIEMFIIKSNISCCAWLNDVY